MEEFSLIERYFHWPIKFNQNQITKSVGDDCAIISPKKNQKLLITTDCLVQNVHFPNNTPADLIAIKSLAVNLSDIAAMGGKPAWYTLVLGLPQAINETWIETFSKALLEQSLKYQVDLVGGDTVKSEQLFITIQMHGYSQNKIMQRDKAKVGDIIAVTGQLGGAALGLKFALDSDEFSSISFTKNEINEALNALSQPIPQIELGEKISHYSDCALDISDGLLADLGHITSASNCGAEINIERIPLADCLLKLPKEQAVKLALTGGDDYQLCFTISKKNWQKMMKNDELSKVCSKIGQIVSSEGIQLLKEANPINQLPDLNIMHLKPGYNHFN
ncbi:MAG: thiamine-phosphate kinase [Gammaproteobacteria bacterium]|nr:thiamine-phosphate kinase [Gammaproteobacteria bacterium]